MKRKVCTKCKVKQAVSQFGKHPQSPDGLQYHCRDCKNAARRAYHATKGREVQREHKTNTRNQNRVRLMEYLSNHPCTDCGEKNPIVLDFHHTGDKENGISQMMGRSYPWVMIEREIAKCIVLCANCHRMHHAMEGGNWRMETLKTLYLVNFIEAATNNKVNF